MVSTGEKNQRPLPQDGEMKIPVFTVLKNSAILKNIFIVNKSPDPEPLASSVHGHDEGDGDVLIVGRHPDCNILLTHPSISRFHLQIQSNTSSQKLSVVDLSSVHGTWVSGRKIEPGMSVDLKEGDTLRIGASSRVYRLHWIPISKAYDLENPFVSELDVAAEAEKGEEDDALPEEEEKAEIVQNENFGSVDKEVQSVDSILESIKCLFPDENLESIPKKEIPSAPPMPENFISFYCNEEGNCPSKNDLQEERTIGFLPTNSESENNVRDIEMQVLSPPHVESSALGCDNLNTAFQGPEKISHFSLNLESLFHVEEGSKAYTEVETPRETNIISTLGEYLRESICLPVVEAVQGTTMQQFQDQQNAQFDAFTSQLPPPIMPKSPFGKCCSNLLTNLDPSSFNMTGKTAVAEMPEETGAENLITEKTLFPVEEATLGTKLQPVKVIEEVTRDSPCDGEKQNKCLQDHKSKYQPNQNASSCLEQAHSMDGIAQDIRNKCPDSVSPEQPFLGITNKKKNRTRQSLIAVAGCSDKKILERHAAEINSTYSNIWSRRGKAPASSPQVRTSKSRLKSTAHVDTEVGMSNQKDIKNKTTKDLMSDSDEKEEFHTPDKENLSPNTLHLRSLKKKGKLEENRHSKSQQRSYKSERRTFGSQIKLEQDIIYTSNQKDVTNKKIQKDLTSDLDEEVEEFHSPDKENLSPNTLQLQLLKKKGKLQEIKHSKSRGLHSSKANFSPNIYTDESNIPISENKNQTPQVNKEQKSKRRPLGSHIELQRKQDIMALEKRLERLPFQSLLMNSGGKSRLETSHPVSVAENINASYCAQILDKCTSPSHISERSWNIIVDTASLLNKESRKALLLLQGLKGTRLIIPRMVIKELDSMKRQFNFFRRTSEASLALEWIEECMVKTKWWIHVQSSMEEERMIAPTPPATPHTQFSEESWNSLLSSQKSSMEIVSPTAEDHILDCALLYRKQKDGQLVLLSDDVTLKIKSMAEGLLCETVQEFRESLVNPFSERFLWANSSPRGLTWSCQDDVVLREKYCRSPLRKSSKGEGAKGLKLILLHNSRYGHSCSAR